MTRRHILSINMPTEPHSSKKIFKSCFNRVTLSFNQIPFVPPKYFIHVQVKRKTRKGKHRNKNPKCSSSSYRFLSWSPSKSSRPGWPGKRRSLWLRVSAGFLRRTKPAELTLVIKNKSAFWSQPLVDWLIPFFSFQRAQGLVYWAQEWHLTSCQKTQLCWG